MSERPNPRMSNASRNRHVIRRLRGTHRALPRLVLAGMTFATLSCSPGCIVREMRDELVAVNASLDRSNDALSESNQMLAQVRDDLKQGNERVAAIEQSLATMHDRLTVLASVEASLKAIDAHLASLRQTLENLDKRIPFVKFADDGSVPPATTQPDH